MRIFECDRQDVKKVGIAILFLLSFVRLHGQEGEVRNVRMDNIEVIGRRPLRDIGVQKTDIDTIALRESIAQSLADVLGQNSTIFIKSYGRATLATASFRGTSASHTQVAWNGMKLNSPMLGMVDFSMIPSWFIDEAALFHGTSSVNVTGGGLGGAISLSTKPINEKGFGLQFVQGIGSFRTFDDYLRLTYGGKRWQSSTRVVYSTSQNDFKYINYDTKVDKVFDEDNRLVSFRYPVQRNRSGEFDDLHVLQELYYDAPTGDRFGLSAWAIHSDRGVPMLKGDSKDESEYVNKQRERTLRAVASWNRLREAYRLSASAGYTATYMGYDHSRRRETGEWDEITRSRSHLHTLYAQAEGEYYLARRWMFTGSLSIHQHFVRSLGRDVITTAGNRDVVGYDQARPEASGYISVKWRPVERLGMSVALREDFYGDSFTPLIPAFFLDYVILKKGDVVAKASVSRNYRYPTLNDMYFLPGGNPDLNPEHGFTYDAGVRFTAVQRERISLKGEATFFDSYIKDWISWLPTTKGFWSPVNIKEVHSYGVELKATLDADLGRGWRLAMDGNFAWTPSINKGDPVSWADAAIGKQLVYVPLYSSAVTGRLSWRKWTFVYKWSYYSERFTTSSNETSMKFIRIPPYFMSDITLERTFSAKWADFSVKAAVNNIFNEHYESVLSRPMPGINFEVFLEIRPRFGRNR